MESSKDNRGRPAVPADAMADRQPRKIPGHQRFSANMTEIVAGFRLLGLEREEDRARLRRLAGFGAPDRVEPHRLPQELGNTTRRTE